MGRDKHGQPRDWRGRFTAERTETTTRTITERITLDHALPAPACGTTTLPPHLRETPVFWQLLRTARWGQDFTVDETARALATDPDRSGPFRPRPPRSMPSAGPPVPYPELAEETLAGELVPLPHWDMS
jgi:hypothetical protein